MPRTALDSGIETTPSDSAGITVHVIEGPKVNSNRGPITRGPQRCTAQAAAKGPSTISPSV